MSIHSHSIEWSFILPLPPLILLVSQLSGEIVRLRNQREALEKDLRSLHLSHTHLEKTFHHLAGRSAKHVTVEEHQQALEEVQRSVWLPQGQLTLLQSHFLFHLPLRSLLEDLSGKTEADSRMREAQIRVSETYTSLCTYRLVLHRLGSIKLSTCMFCMVTSHSILLQVFQKEKRALATKLTGMCVAILPCIQEIV